MPLRHHTCEIGPSLSRDSIGRREAFTLLELLVVITIMGVLSTLSIMVISKVRSSANAAKCGSNLRAIGVGLLAYAADHRGDLPPCASLPNSNYKISFRSKTFWFDALNPYMGYPNYAADRLEPFPAPASENTEFPFPWQLCPAKTTEPLQRQSVGYGWNISNFGLDYSRKDTTGFGASINQIPDPARTIIIGDSKDEYVQPENAYQDRYIYDYDSEKRVPYPARHSGGGNYLFVDGHIQLLSAESMSTPEVIRMFKRTN